MPRRRTPGTAGLPILATAVPVLGAVGLWAVTGSVLSLWFAALAPMMAVAGFGDRLWAARRAGRRDTAVAQQEAAAFGAAVEQLVDRERRRAWRRSPDIRRFLDEPGEVWREVPGRQGTLLLGSGDLQIALAPDQLADLRAQLASSETTATIAEKPMRTMSDAPVAVPLNGALAVVGPEPLVAGAVRAMLLQLCLVHPPGRLQVVGHLPDGFSWVELLPHRVTPGQRRVALVTAEGWDPSAGETDAAILIGKAGGGGVRVVLAQTDSGAPRATIDTGEDTQAICPQVLSEVQARRLARSLSERIAPTVPDDGALALEGLIDAHPGSASGAGARSLASVIGRSGAAPFCLDLVADGPHALVVGTTGSGKSELLRTWVAALASRYTPEDVVFVLADFKGGTAFASLERFPHVTGVLTDLDEAGASRGLESLRAEVRRRESVLAAAGIRDIAEGAADLPRLVVVVDEFATLVSAHGELASLFVDLTARGRALGIHVVLGTQRATGVFRDALLANCLLRVALRTADAADSRLMIGDDSAIRIPASARSAGTALVKRSGDDRPVPVRIAVAGDDLIAQVADRSTGAPARAPWLEPLPAVVPFPTLPAEGESRILVGLADEPHLQRQEPVGVDRRARGVCVIGTSGSGVTTTLRMLGSQIDHIDAWVGAGDLEAAWDDLNRVAASRRGGVVVDGADALLAALPSEYAQAAVGLFDAIARASGADGPFLLGLERLTGSLARVADLLPHRLLLRHAQRPDYLASGGAARHHDPAAPPGRGRLDGTLVHVFRIEPPSELAETSHPPVWQPPVGLTCWVTRATSSAERIQARWHDGGVEVRSADEALGAGLAPAREPGRSVILRAEPEHWQRMWAALTTLRAQGPLLIDPSCAGEYRLLTGRRELPPLCVPGAERGWLLEPGRDVRRVRLG